MNGLTYKPSFEKWLKGEEITPFNIFISLDSVSTAIGIAKHLEKTDKNFLIISPTGKDARFLIDDLKFFAPSNLKNRIYYIPAFEFDYHKSIFPSPEIALERNVALFHALKDEKKSIFVTNAKTLCQKAFTPQKFIENVISLSKGEEIIGREQFVQKLINIGYQKQPSSFDKGVFSVRGGVIDIFSPLYDFPARIEFFGNTIEDIRFFDPQSQRSINSIDIFNIIPVSTVILPSLDEYNLVIKELKLRLDSIGIPKNRREEIAQKILEGEFISDYTLLFPIICAGSANLIDYFTEAQIFWCDYETTISILDDIYSEFDKNYNLFLSNSIPISEKESIFINKDTFLSLAKKNHVFFERFSKSPSSNALEIPSKPVYFEKTFIKKDSLKLLQGFANRFKSWLDDGFVVAIVCHTRTHAEHIQYLFEPYGIKSVIHSELSLFEIMSFELNRLHLVLGVITTSVLFETLRLVIINEEELFGHKKRVIRTSSHWQKLKSNIKTSFRTLKEGDYVVHKEHGIGKYLGLKSMNVDGTLSDFFAIEYRDGDKLYIPVYRLKVLQKYSEGSEKKIALDKLGGDRWPKVKKRAEKAIAELAVELLNIQAKRRLIPSFVFSPIDDTFRQFEMEFPFDETPDQIKVIDEIMEDMSRNYPMDRLLCGDVGYGKTEVAMRAAYRTCLDSRQVALLVPTTVLAFQHYQTFSQRFSNTAVRVEMISRLKTKREIKIILKDLKEGKIDIIIGTHRLLSSDVEFKSLGLVIVDEEHRFGVLDKERLRKLAASVHYLSMTATPIPRTLNMTLNNIKELSVLMTPPPDRLSIRTFVCRRSKEVIIEAINNELSRGGQVFFIHNRIASLSGVANELSKWLPELKFETIHGKMSADELERKMIRFYKGDLDLLLTTAIIESGLDVPRANTIIIDMADHFGLAELYQLRGRVGRSDKRAYCYLLIPSEKSIEKEAKERLSILQRYSELGSGFHIATYDLEIRGAGDLLGKAQSGHILAIGPDYYFELLDNYIHNLKGEKLKSEIEPEISMKIAAYIPNDYIADITEKVNIYKRLSNAETEEDVSEIELEMVDRFGPLTNEVINLLQLMKIRLYLKLLHVTRMACGIKKNSLQFASSTPVSPDAVIKLIKSFPQKYALTSDQKLIYTISSLEIQNQLSEIKKIVSALIAS